MSNTAFADFTGDDNTPVEAQDGGLNGRRIFNWNGRNPVATVNAFADAIAETAALFNIEEYLIWVHDGQRIPVNREILQKIIDLHFCRRIAINTGTETKPFWTVDYVSFEFPPVGDLSQGPNLTVLNILLGVRTRVDQPTILGLLERVPKA